MNQMDLIPEADRTEYLCRTNANLAKSTYVLQEHRLHRKDGKDIYVFVMDVSFTIRQLNRIVQRLLFQMYQYLFHEDPDRCRAE